jgi:hypothetical protein
MCPYDAMYNSITDVVLYLDITDSGAAAYRIITKASTPKMMEHLRGDEELIFDINEMFGHLNRYISQQNDGSSKPNVDKKRVQVKSGPRQQTTGWRLDRGTHLSDMHFESNAQFSLGYRGTTGQQIDIFVTRMFQ